MFGLANHIDFEDHSTVVVGIALKAKSDCHPQNR